MTRLPLTRTLVPTLPKAFVLAVALMLPLGPTPATAQASNDVQALIDRIDRLERDVRTLNVQLSRGPAATDRFSLSEQASETPSAGAAAAPPEVKGPAAARLAVRLTTLEEEIRALVGRIEEMGYRVSQNSDRLDKLIGDLDYRLGSLEGGRRSAAQAAQPAAPISSSPTFKAEPQSLGQLTAKDLAAVQPPNTGGVSSEPIAAPSGTAGTTAVEGAPVSAAPSTPSVAPQPTAQAQQPTEIASAEAVPESLGTPKEQYGEALSLLRRAEYDRAEAALKAFVERNPEDDLAGNARYWLGETHYVRGQYLQAAEVFLEGYQKSPKGNKAPDTLLKLGMSLAALDKKEQACASFGKLKTDFSDLSKPLETELKRQTDRIGCK